MLLCEGIDYLIPRIVALRCSQVPVYYNTYVLYMTDHKFCVHDALALCVCVCAYEHFVLWNVQYELMHGNFKFAYQYELVE